VFGTLDASCASGARDLSSLRNQVVAVPCVWLAKDACERISGASHRTGDGLGRERSGVPPTMDKSSRGFPGGPPGAEIRRGEVPQLSDLPVTRLIATGAVKAPRRVAGLSLRRAGATSGTGDSLWPGR